MLRSSILSIADMDRHKGGIYVCKAENGVGVPASSQVILHVLCKRFETHLEQESRLSAFTFDLQTHQK